ncbi:MAG TPA: hypothetical protein VD968_15075 [Pyrinomonadaceae bacterium]|nr:hypothetical protein [Pyrinomonadaceae bacterium]
MPVVKKRNQQTESRLLLESDDPVELPPAEVEDSAVVLQFEQFRQYVPELLEELRDGTLAEPVPVMMDGSTFVIHGDTRSFWVKLWHSSPERSRVERVQVISCLPSTRGMQLIVDGPDDYDDDEDADEDDYGDEVDYLDHDDLDDDDDEGAAGDHGQPR